MKNSGSASQTPPCRALGGLLVRRERWTLSWTGKLCFLFVILGLFVIWVRCSYPFLACTSRESEDTMVLEGWIPTYTLEQVASEFKAGNYQRLIVVRALYSGKDRYESGKYMSDYMADALIRLGIPKARVNSIFLDATRTDRTYSSALAVKKWLQERGELIKTIDVVTLGTHARRSRLLFRLAFGSDVKVGVIACEDLNYDPAHWWRYSAGVRDVPAECGAYLYTKLFFSPTP